MSKQLIKEIEPHRNLYRDTVTGIVWIEDNTSGNSISIHANIHKSGSAGGMKRLGYWRRNDVLKAGSTRLILLFAIKK